MQLDDDSKPWMIAKPDSNPNRPMPVSFADYETATTAAWRELLDSNPEETDVQAFLELNPAMIPGGHGEVGPGGHHGSEMRAVFREPNLIGLGRDFRPDFMWVTRSTASTTALLIEIEKPSKEWYLKSGVPTAQLTQARDQIQNWREWFTRPGNMEIFRQTYLFDHDFNFQPVVPYFLLIFGRQSEFTEGGKHKDPRALAAKRDSSAGSDEQFMTFDSLKPNYNSYDSLTVTRLATGPEVFAFSPGYCTGGDSGPDALRLGGIESALLRTEGMSHARKEYLGSRWGYWQEYEKRRIRSGKMQGFSIGSE